MRCRPAAAVAALLLMSASAFADVKIAVVNPIKVLNSLAETQDLNKSMESEQATFKADGETRQQKLKDLTAQRDQVKPESPQYVDMTKQLTQARADLQAWAQTKQQDMQRGFRDKAKRMNDKINAAIKQIAQDKKIDLVLADQKPELTDQQMETMQPQQIMGVLFGRNILFNTDGMDLTQEVIAKLDAVYKAK